MTSRTGPQLNMQSSSRQHSRSKIPLWTVLAIGSVCFVVSLTKVTQARSARIAEAKEQARHAEQVRQEEEETQDEMKAQERHKAALASVHFETDPQSDVPVMTLGDLTSRIWDRRNPLNLKYGQKVKLTATLQNENLYQGHLSFVNSPQAFLFQEYSFDFNEGAIRDLHSGQEVEFIAMYLYSERSDSSSDRYDSFKARFNGLEVHALSN